MSYLTLLNDIKELVTNPNTTLEEVITKKYVPLFYSQGTPCLIQFLISKSEELLELAINSPDQTLKTKSFEIICGDNADVIQSMISKNVISKVTEKFVFDQNTTPTILSALINIFERCFAVDFTKSSNQLYFIPELVHFLNYQEVVAFFADCSEQPIFGRKFIQWLNELEFDTKLIDTLQNEINKTQNDPDFLNGLYIILDNCVKDERVRSRLLTPSKLSLIIQPCRPEIPNYVKISHAKIILDSCNEFTIQFVSDLQSYLTTIIFGKKDVNFNDNCDQNRTEIEGNLKSIQITELFLLCFQILIKINTIKQPQNSFSFSVLLDVAFFILNDHQDHSFALIVASDFVVQCVQMEGAIGDDALGRLLPFARRIFQTSLNLNIVAFAYKMMVGVKEKAGENKDEFNSIYEKYVVPKKTVIDSEYGGEAPPLEIVI